MLISTLFMSACATQQVPSVCTKPPSLKFYVGANGGVVASFVPSLNKRLSNYGSGPAPSEARGNYCSLNPVLGVHAGLRHYCGAWFLGLEGSSSFLLKAHIDKSASAFEKTEFRAHKDWSHEAVLHLGRDFDRWSVYGKGGLNYARVSYHYVGDKQWDATASSPFEDKKGIERLGVVFGGGIEYKVSKSITLGTEVAYSQLRKFEKIYPHEAADGRVNGAGFSPRGLDVKLRLSLVF